MPSPELGAGPTPGLSSFCQSSRPNPLPSGSPSPELGAGPKGSSTAATVPQKMLPKTKSNIEIPTILFNLFPPVLILSYR